DVGRHQLIKARAATILRPGRACSAFHGFNPHMLRHAGRFKLTMMAHDRAPNASKRAIAGVCMVCLAATKISYRSRLVRRVEHGQRAERVKPGGDRNQKESRESKRGALSGSRITRL